jgi:hypothetical protein
LIASPASFALLPLPLGRLLASAKVTHAPLTYSSVSALPSADTLRPALRCSTRLAPRTLTEAHTSQA